MGTLRDEHTAAAQGHGQAPPVDEAMVRDLADIDAGMGELVGGKAANLGELIAAGFTVPRGFCVSTDAYQAVANLPELHELVEGLNGVTDPAEQARVAARIRELLVRAPVPAELAAAIAEAYARLGRGTAAPVAVRSSATAEDLPFASFAGQQDTFLNVVGADSVRDAVSRCWASLWTDRAVSYRASHGIDHRVVRLAVVVQHMIDSEVAGVLFTANPVTGKRTESVVDASPGLGEAVVSGAVDPDHFVLGENAAVLQRRLGGKQLAIRPTAGGGTTEVAAAADTGGADGKACITDGQLRELAALGRRVTEHYGTPQDIEWALDADGRLWLTQARPITTLYPLPVPRREGLRVYFSANVAQGVIQPFTPMGAAGLRALAGSAAKTAGFDISDPLDGPPAFVDSGCRIFIDVTAPIRSALGRELVPRMFDVMEARSAVIFRDLMTDPRLSIMQSRAQGLHRLVRAAMRVRAPIWAGEALLRPDAARRRAFRRAAEVDRLTRPPASSLSAQQRVDEAVRMLTEVAAPRLVRVMPLIVVGFALAGLSPKILGKAGTAEDIRAAQRGIPHNVTTEMDLELGRLASVIRAEPAAASTMSDTPTAELVRRYRDSALPPVAQRGLEAFLERYGHRAVAEIDLGVPRWSDDPTHPLGMIANYLRVDDHAWAAEQQFAQGAAEAEAMVIELVARTRQRYGRARAWLLGKALHRYRALAGVRELPKYCLVLVMARAREQLAAAGTELAEAGRLERAEDVFFLDLREARAAVRGADLRELVELRRADHERELRRRHVPRMLLSDGTEPEAVAAAGEQVQEGALVGTAASAGSISGIARVVLDPVGAHLAPGEILVAPSTDPGWTPLFLTAGGLVMEMGGPNSHGAVVAREYGIPAVVGVPGATERITTGQRITVNGAAGTVTVD